MVATKKVLLISKSGYNVKHNAMLKKMIDEGVELFCAVGKNCEAWEEAMDWLCDGPDGEEHIFINTSSHPDESVEEVLGFAKQWRVRGGNNEITVIEI
jgi:hypothetical protein